MTDVFFLIHAISGSIAIGAGMAAPFFKKFGKSHRNIGTVFFYAMLCLGLSGAIGAYVRDIPLSLLNGLLICYFVTTSKAAIKQTGKRISHQDYISVLFIAALTLGYVGYAMIASKAPEGKLAGFGWPAFIAFGAVAAFCLASDIYYIINGGASGKARIIRHLWRMLFPLFMATAAFFLGQARLFPEALRSIEILAMPVAFVVGMLLFWVIRVKVSSHSALTQTASIN